MQEICCQDNQQEGLLSGGKSSRRTHTGTHIDQTVPSCGTVWGTSVLENSESLQSMANIFPCSG